MRYTKAFERLGLPDYFIFGIELEADNVKTKGKNGLYTGESAKYINERNWHMASFWEEALVGDGGAELVSPKLTDSEHTWQNIADICAHIQKFPGKNGDKVVANSKCGLHIHFDSECLTSNPDIFRNFMRLYVESEELLFKMCNDKNNPIRKYAIHRNFKGVQLISSIWRNGMASPTGKKILEKIQNGTLKVSYKKFGRFKMALSKLKLDERRYSGLNLTNIGNPNKNTIEFRMSNGTLNPEVIKQNVFLYASLINTAIQMYKTPEQFVERLEEFYRTDVSEEEKAQSFLKLVMSDENDRKIYMDRWQSVKDAKVFSHNNKKGFAQNRFKREQFTQIAMRTPVDRIKTAFAQLKELLLNTKEKGDFDYDK